MTNQRSRQLITVLMVFGAVIFGMILAGSLDLTTPGIGAPESAKAASAPVHPAVQVGAPNFADLVDRVSGAVVSIEARTFETADDRRRRRGTDPFEFFFNPRRRQPAPENDQEFRSESGGSGFVISADGLVVTNNHVIRDAEEVLVRLGERSFPAKVKGTDPATDLALLKIDGEEFDYLPLGDSSTLRVGEWVMAIGSPQGLVGTVTVGVVSAKDRRINISQETTSFENFIQTDAAINFGNSGGPLLNMRGEVVGINTAINYGSENIGFAVPVAILERILPQLRDSGRVRRGYLGIGVNDLDADAAEAFGLDSTDGALVTSVEEGLPADKAGLEPGDIILKAGEARITRTRELIDYVSSLGPDQEVDIEILRNGKRLTKEVKLAERPSSEVRPEAEAEDDESGIDWLDIRYQGLTPGLRSMHGIPEDVEGVWLTSVSPRSPLYDEGVRTGQVINVITQVNGETVTTVEGFETIVKAAPAGSRLRIYLRRFAGGEEGQPLFVFPPVPDAR